MKAKILFLLMCLPLLAQAQTTYDTVEMRQPNYYYTNWYDTSDWFLNPDKYPVFVSSERSVKFNPRWTTDTTKMEVYQHYTPTRLKATGIWFLLSHKIYAPDFPSGGTDTIIWNRDKLPEYVCLYSLDTTLVDTVDLTARNCYLHLRATARWDTLHPKMVRLPRTADRRYNDMYCLLVEAYFDSVCTIPPGEFWIGGTGFSNGSRGADNPHHVGWSHIPSIYLGVECFRRGESEGYRRYAYGTYPEGPWTPPVGKMAGCNPFGLIVNGQKSITVLSADTSMGDARTSAYYPDSSFQTITAVPRYSYRFSHWDDGNTDNPRTIFVTQDSVFTAHFSSAEQYTVDVQSSDNSLGHVTGGGVYYDGEVAELTAISDIEQSYFVRWDDGDTANPRYIVVESDTSFTAFFDTASHDTTGIARVAKPAVLFTLTPNPTTGKVTVTVGHTPQSGTHSSVSKADSSPNLGEQLILTLRDAAGHEVMRKEFSIVNSQFSIPLDLRHLPAGAYFVTLSTPTASSTQRLVVK